VSRKTCTELADEKLSEVSAQGFSADDVDVFYLSPVDLDTDFPSNSGFGVLHFNPTGWVGLKPNPLVPVQTVEVLWKAHVVRGVSLAETLLDTWKHCDHAFPDTGMLKSWCKHCDAVGIFNSSTCRFEATD
jgi:hypothetical protein